MFRNKLSPMWILVVLAVVLNGCGVVTTKPPVDPEKRATLKRLGLVSVASASDSELLEPTAKMISERLPHVNLTVIKRTPEESKVVWGVAKSLGAVWHSSEKEVFLARVKQIAAEQNLDGVILLRDGAVSYHMGNVAYKVSGISSHYQAPVFGIGREGWVISMAITVRYLEPKTLEQIGQASANSGLINTGNKLQTREDSEKLNSDIANMVNSSMHFALQRLGL